MDISIEEDENRKNVYLKFEGYDKVTEIIHLTFDTKLEDAYKINNYIKQLTGIFNEYISQPNLLSSYLEEILKSLLLSSISERYIDEIKNAMIEYTLIITSTVRLKRVLKFIDHDENNFEPVFSSLLQAKSNKLNWKREFVLLMWLSSILTSPIQIFTDKSAVLTTFVEAIKDYIESITNPFKTILPILVSNLFIRKDVSNDIFESFFEYLLCNISAYSKLESPPVIQCCVILHTMNYLYLRQPKDVIEKYASRFLLDVDYPSLLLRKIKTVTKHLLKTLYSISNIYLPPLPDVSFYYTRVPEHKVIRENITYENNLFHLNIIENISDLHYKSLCEAYFEVRFSAAKGLAKIASRLNKEHLDRIIDNVILMFNEINPYYYWQGGCLCIAEFASRGFLSTSFIPIVIPYITKAICYEENSASATNASSVRDTACYVCWAFARAFNPSELSPFIATIAGHLVITSLFDVQLTCRRSASAAFQENVGRQANFPNGIEVSTSINFLSISDVKKCYLKISPKVAKYPEYFEIIVTNLLNYRLSHKDENIQLYSSQALGLIAPHNPQYFIDKVLPEIYLRCSKYIWANNLRAIGEILENLALTCQSQLNSLNPPFTNYLEIPFKIASYKFTKMFTTTAKINLSLFMIRKMCSLKSVDPQLLNQWLEFNLKHFFNRSQDVRDSAQQCFTTLITYYSTNKEFRSKIENYIVKISEKYLSSSDCFLRIGISLIIRCSLIIISEELLKNFTLASVEVLKGIMRSGSVEEKEEVNELLTSLTIIMINFNNHSFISENLNSPLLTTIEIANFYLYYFPEDYYSEESSNIRKIALSCIKDLFHSICEKQSSSLIDLDATHIISRVLSLCYDRSSKVRTQAFDILKAIINHKNVEILKIDSFTQIKDIFKEELNNTLNDFTSYTLKILYLPVYIKHVLPMLCYLYDSEEVMNRHANSILSQFFNDPILKNPGPVKNEIIACFTLMCGDPVSIRSISGFILSIEKLLESKSFWVSKINDSCENLISNIITFLSSLIHLNSKIKILINISHCFCLMYAFKSVHQVLVTDNLIKLLSYEYPIIRRESSNYFNNLFTDQNNSLNQSFNKVMKILLENESLSKITDLPLVIEQLKLLLN